jgi:biotin carboxyl carrier protein
MRYFVDVAGDELELELERLPEGGFRVTPSGAPGEPFNARLVASSHDLCTLEIAGRLLELRLGRDGEAQRVLGVATRVESAGERAARTSQPSSVASSVELRAPMPGRILRVLCAAGASVSQGSALLVIEAMKMENELCAKSDTLIVEVHVNPGDTVERNALLLRFG